MEEYEITMPSPRPAVLTKQQQNNTRGIRPTRKRKIPNFLNEAEDREDIENKQPSTQQVSKVIKLNIFGQFDSEQQSESKQSKREQQFQQKQVNGKGKLDEQASLGELEEVEKTLDIVRRFQKLNQIQWSNDSEELTHQEIKEDQEKNQLVQKQQRLEAQKIIKLPEDHKIIQNQKMWWQAGEHSFWNELAQGTRTRCLLRRDKKNREGIPEYNIYCEDTFHHLITIRKERGSQFRFYIRENKIGPTFTYRRIGNMDVSLLGNQFKLYRANYKYCNMEVNYQTNLLGWSGPRKIKAYLSRDGIGTSELQDGYESGKWREKIVKCTSKSARWNQKIKSFVLHLRGRASEPSIKNLVMTDQKDAEDLYYVVFGKAGTDVFHLDIERPFSFVQGVALALTTFDSKITCD